MTKPREWTATNERFRQGDFGGGNWTTEDVFRGPPLKRGEKIKVREVTEETARLPEFDEAAATNAGFDHTCSIFGLPADQIKGVSATTIFAKGAYWQHQQLAHIVAAKDAEIKRLEERDHTWLQREELLQKRIGELEEDINLHNEASDAQSRQYWKAQERIAQLEAALEKCKEEFQELIDAISSSRVVAIESATFYEFRVATKWIDKIEEKLGKVDAGKEKGEEI